MVAPATNAVAKAIFKHVDIAVTSHDFVTAYVGALRSCEKICSLMCDARWAHDSRSGA